MNIRKTQGVCPALRLRPEVSSQMAVCDSLVHVKLCSQTYSPDMKTSHSQHICYTSRQLLEELRTALPGDKSHSWYENSFDARAYKQLCSELDASPGTEWWQKLDHCCQGLGSYGTYFKQSGQYRSEHQAQGPFFHPKDLIKHNLDILRACTTFILDKSDGSTQEGIGHLNDMIRTYVWAILGAQAQTLSNILKAETGSNALKTVPGEC